jgi:uncharacterized damage-inducible protein DinB
METKTATATVITPEALLSHWQGHRALTRRMIEAFPEKELFSFSVGGMRPFANLAMEMVDLANPGMHGLVTNEWKEVHELSHHTGEGMPETKEDLLVIWDETTQQINRLWAMLSPERFQENTVAFNQFAGPVFGTIFYFIDNEIHHRGQGYVYLRALGIAPPAFWDR